MLKEAASEFAHSVVAPHVREMEEETKLKPEIIRALFEQGLMSIEIPEKLGGSGPMS